MMNNRFATGFILLSLTGFIGNVFAAGIKSPPGSSELATLPLEEVNRIPGIRAVEIDFSHEKPIENGLTFKRKLAKFKPATFKDAKHSPAWVVESSDDPSAGWMRYFRLRVTDPRLRDGARPAIDMYVTYHLPTWAGVLMEADTADGMRTVGNGWGDTKNWRTTKVRIDDARFSSGKDEWDLAIAGANTGFYIQRIRLISYDTERDIHWDRMLKIPRITAQTADGLFIFDRGNLKFTAQIQNVARADRPLQWAMEVEDADGQIVGRGEGALTATAAQTVDLPISLSAGDWRLGPYRAVIAFRLEAEAPTLWETPVHLGLINSKAAPRALPKARTGEFYFGLDPSNSHIYDPAADVALAWYDLMGVDIIRNIPHRGNLTNVDQAAKALEKIAARGVRAMGMAEVDDPGRKGGDRERYAEKQRELVGAIAERFTGDAPGKIKWWELGNEPDLPFFYKGPIAEYVKYYERMYDAIKQGAVAGGHQPTDTVVMNGGLCFYGADGDRRAREFVRLIDPAKLDAFAYHGHGPGVKAERDAWQRLHAEASKDGKGNIPLIETESGFSGNNRNGLAEQARTAVEKTLFAQSKGAPTLMFFRLFMEGEGTEGGYGLTHDKTQPRPSVLAYRNMVVQLRHARFERRVDFAGKVGADGVEAYLFQIVGDDGMPGGEKVLAAFCTSNARHDLLVQLGLPGVSVDRVNQVDLYGNTKPADRVAGNIAKLPVAADTVYLTWRCAGDCAGVEPVPSILSLAPSDSVNGELPILLTGAENKLVIDVRAPGDQALAGMVELKAFGRVPMAIEPSGAEVSAPQRLPITINVDPAAVPLDMPHWWAVFLDADAAKIMADPNLLATLPDDLPKAGGGRVAGQYVMLDGRSINLGKIAGGIKEKRPAMLFATLESSADVTMPVAASADWWMAWFVNGQRVYSTLDTGNRHGTLADHTFDLPLKKGTNVIAATVLSGSGGWAIDIAGPKQRAIAISGGVDPDRIEATLTTQAVREPAARLVLPVRLQTPIPPLGKMADEADLKSWMKLEPLAVLGTDQVTNLHLQFPEQSRWYKGEKDLSATIWLRQGDDGTVYVAVATVDADWVANGDDIEIVLADESGKVLASDKKSRTRSAAAPIIFTFPPGAMPAGPMRVSVRVNDCDPGIEGVKQHADLGDVDHPARGVRQMR